MNASKYDVFTYGLFVIVMFQASQVSASTALEISIRNAFEDFQNCMRQAGTPTACEEVIVVYVERANSLLRVAPRNDEKSRLESMVEFVLRRADDYNETAQSLGDRDAAQKAVSLYQLLVKIDPDSADLYVAFKAQASGITGAGDAVIRLERHFSALRSELLNNQALSDKSVAALRVAVQRFYDLPISLRGEVYDLGVEVDRWLMKYLDWMMDNPLKINVGDLRQRLWAYVHLQKLDSPPKNRQSEISESLRAVAKHINAAAKGAATSLKEASDHWSAVHAGSGLKLSGKEVRLKADLIEQTSVASKVATIKRDSGESLSALYDLIEVQPFLIEESVWEEWVAAFLYLSQCGSKDLSQCYLALQGLKGFSNPRLIKGDQFANGEEFISNLLAERISAVVHEDIESALSLLIDLDYLTSGSFMDRYVIEHALDLFDEVLDADHPVDTITGFVPFFVSLHERVPGCSEMKMLRMSMLDVIQRSLDSYNLEARYSRDGFTEVWRYLDGLPNLLEGLSAIEKNERVNDLYSGLFDAQIFEVSVGKDLYSAMTRPIAFQDVQPAFDAWRAIGEVAGHRIIENCFGSYAACSGSAELVRNEHYDRAAKAERSLRNRLPRSRSDQQEILSKDDFLLCVFEQMASGEVTGSGVQEFAQDLEAYSIVSVIMVDKFDAQSRIFTGMSGIDFIRERAGRGKSGYDLSSMRRSISVCIDSPEAFLPHRNE